MHHRQGGFHLEQESGPTHSDSAHLASTLGTSLAVAIDLVTDLGQS